MLKVALIGLGSIGRVHLENYIQLKKEGFPIKLVAICNRNIKSKINNLVVGNNEVDIELEIDFDKYNLYNDLDQMLENEDIDIVDICLPTNLHAEISIKAMKKGYHVFCEKPMSLTETEAKKMLETSQEYNKKLMIGQTLRFSSPYEYIKKCIKQKKYDEVLSAFFYRSSGVPLWCDWLIDKNKSGGVILDLHIHDVDCINWLFGKPNQLSSSEMENKESGYNTVSTNFNYDNMVINAQAGWVGEEVPFNSMFRVDFEEGSLIYQNEQLKEVTGNGIKLINITDDNPYYKEIKYFADLIINDKPVDIVSPDSTKETIFILNKIKESANKNEKVNLFN